MLYSKIPVAAKRGLQYVHCTLYSICVKNKKYTVNLTCLLSHVQMLRTVSLFAIPSSFPIDLNPVTPPPPSLSYPYSDGIGPKCEQEMGLKWACSLLVCHYGAWDEAYTCLHTARKVLADFALCDGRRKCKALCDVKIRQIEGSGRKFSHMELTTSVIG